MRYGPARHFAALARFILRAVLRAVITGLVMTFCVAAALSYLGIPLPDLSEMLDRVESVSQLAKILS